MTPKGFAQFHLITVLSICSFYLFCDIFSIKYNVGGINPIQVARYTADLYISIIGLEIKVQCNITI